MTSVLQKRSVWILIPILWTAFAVFLVQRVKAIIYTLKLYSDLNRAHSDSICTKLITYARRRNCCVNVYVCIMCYFKSMYGRHYVMVAYRLWRSRPLCDSCNGNLFLQQTAGGTTFSGINRPRLRSPGNSGAAGRGCRLYSHINTVPDNDPDFSNTRSWLNSKLLETLQVRDSIWFISLLL